jgi:O-antigen/teichoic acid export membrane protein
MNNSLIRYLPVWPDRPRTANGAMTVVALAALVSSAGFVAIVPSFASQVAGVRNPAGAVAFVALTVSGAVGLYYDNVIISVRRCGYLLVRNGVVVVLRVALPGLLVSAGAGGIFAAYWLPMTIALGWYGLVLERTLGLPPRLTVAPDRLRAMWRYSAGTYLATAILMTPNLLMPVLVVQWIGPHEAALYAIAALLAGVLGFVPQATARSLFAEVANEPARLREQLSRVLRLTVALQAPLLAAVVLAGRPLLATFGPVYAGAYPLLVLLAVAGAVSSISFVGSTLLLVSGQIRSLCQISAAGCAVSLLGAYLFAGHGLAGHGLAGHGLAGHGLAGIGWSLLAGETILAARYTTIIAGRLRAGRAG